MATDVRVYAYGDDRSEHTQPCVTILDVSGDCEIWLDTGVGDFDGICIGSAMTRSDAIRDALASLEAAVAALKAEAKS